ncbi:MAG: LacI family DNA-binding transcriptional regulator [Hyphomicrobiaceae bacterium]
MSKVNLKALSAHLGLAEGTVSRAMNDYPDISERTVQRVKAAASELGYRPNSNARRLATRNAECIGFILPWQEGNFSQPFLGELLDGLSEALLDKHWDLMVAVAQSPRDELSTIDRLARSGRVNGLVISRTLIRDPRIQRMMDLGLPFVSHGRTADAEDYAWFDIDNAEVFREAVTHLANLGHSRIAHIHGSLDYNFAAARLSGYRQGLAENGLAQSSLYEVRSDLSAHGGHRAANALLALRDHPTAIVCVSDTVALGAMKAIRERGWRPGREVSVIGYDGLPLCEHSDPPLTSIVQPLQAAGKRIGEMLLAVIDGDDPRNHQELWTASLERRETDNPPVSSNRPQEAAIRKRQAKPRKQGSKP